MTGPQHLEIYDYKHELHFFFLFKIPHSNFIQKYNISLTQDKFYF